MHILHNFQFLNIQFEGDYQNTRSNLQASISLELNFSLSFDAQEILIDQIDTWIINIKRGFETDKSSDDDNDDDCFCEMVHWQKVFKLPVGTIAGDSYHPNSNFKKDLNLHRT